MPPKLRRIACLRVPDFSIIAHLRAESGVQCDGAGIVVRGEGARAEVAAASSAARRCGIREGMRAADARGQGGRGGRGLHPKLREWVWTPSLYDQVQTELAASLLAASPRVSRAGLGAFWLDARGWDRRGGERAFIEAARAAALAAGYPAARIGVADTAAAARAATRLTGRAVHQVPQKGDARFLATLPIDVLPVSVELFELLQALGLETVGELAELESAEVEARLGGGGVEAQRWARGLDDGREGLGPGVAVSEWTVEVELPGPAESLEPLLFLLKSCLDHLSSALATEGLCVQSLTLTIETEDGPSTHPVKPARSTRSVPLLLALCRSALDGLQLPGRALAIRVEADEVTPAVAEQADLFEAARPDPDALAMTLTRLQGRWGPESVVRPAAADSHRPEREGRWEPVELLEELTRRGSAANGNGVEPTAAVAEEPSLVLRLWPRPRPLEVRIEDGCPGAVTVDGAWRRVRAFGGPERLSGDWWEDPYQREYYRVSTEKGDLLWVFYDPHPGAWFWHGWWD